MGVATQIGGIVKVVVPVIPTVEAKVTVEAKAKVAEASTYLSSDNVKQSLCTTMPHGRQKEVFGKLLVKENVNWARVY